jgi:predicted RNase H-like HicB family nuclease
MHSSKQPSDRGGTMGTTDGTKTKVPRPLLFCVAQGREGDWEAFCLDFDLAVQASSFDDARSRLEQAIMGYVESAMKEDEPARSSLLSRRAPLWVRLKWGLRFLRASLSGRNRDSASPAGFSVPCPA